jgi:8-oxoguanine deaminase
LLFKDSSRFLHEQSVSEECRSERGKCADFFSINLHSVDYAGALHDPVAATVFCAPQKARYTVINGRVVVENGEVATVNMGPVIEEHNRWSLILAERA